MKTTGIRNTLVPGKEIEVKKASIWAALTVIVMGAAGYLFFDYTWGELIPLVIAGYVLVEYFYLSLYKCVISKKYKHHRLVRAVLLVVISIATVDSFVSTVILDYQGMDFLLNLILEFLAIGYFLNGREKKKE